MPAAPSPTRKPRLAAADTANSLVSTEPITFRGCSRPSASSAGVATGPQPPPPVASMKPANRPSGARNLRLMAFLNFGGAKPITNRAST